MVPAHEHDWRPIGHADQPLGEIVAVRHGRSTVKEIAGNQPRAEALERQAVREDLIERGEPIGIAGMPVLQMHVPHMKEAGHHGSTSHAPRRIAAASKASGVLTTIQYRRASSEAVRAITTNSDPAGARPATDQA